MNTTCFSQEQNDNFSRKLDSALSISGKIRETGDENFDAWLGFQVACGELIRVTNERNGDAFFVKSFF